MIRDLLLIAALSLLMGFGLGFVMATPSGDTIQLRECATEDSDNCYWDAEVRGNRQGKSFVVIDGQAYYPEP